MRMKRAIVLALALVLLAASACAQTKIVVNPGAWNERLNLRESASRKADSLGRFYTGTRVHVLKEGDVWSLVRIAQGTYGDAAQGYMMNEYLSDIDGSRVCSLPCAKLLREETLRTRAGEAIETRWVNDCVYVMAWSRERAYVRTAVGAMGYLPWTALEGGEERPSDQNMLYLERVATPAQGAALHLTADADSPVVAQLAGGVFLTDSFIAFGGDQQYAVMVALGDGEDEARGFLLPGDWTWTDNGADCGWQYPVYCEENQLCEVLGTMADGREIVRRGGTVLGDAVTLDAPKDWGEPLGRAGSYAGYEQPLAGEVADETAVESAVDALLRAGASDAATGQTLMRESLAALTPRITRCQHPNYRDKLLLIDFENEQGVSHAFVQIDPDTGRVISLDNNG